MDDNKRKEVYIPTGKRPTVTIHLSKGGKSAAARRPRKSAADDSEETRPAYIPEDDFVAPGVPKTYLHDLGTRLRTVVDINPDTEDTPELRSRLRLRDAVDVPVSATQDEPQLDKTLEYVEIAIDGQAEEDTLSQLDPDNEANGANLGINADIPLDRQREFDKAYLGSRWRDPEHPDDPPADPLDPLGNTNAVGSLRRIPNCVTLPFLTQDDEGDGDYWDAKLEVDVTLYRPDDEEDEPQLLIAASKSRPKVDELGYDNKPMLENERWKERVEKPEKDELERWNPINVQDDMTGLNFGYIDTKNLGGGYQLRIDSRIYYERFDTGDTDNFKVTRTPYPEGDEVDFRFSGNQEGHIYLKPKYLMGNPGFSWSRSQTYRAHTNYFSEETPIGEVFRPYPHFNISIDTTNFVTLFIQQLEYDEPNLPVAGTEVVVTQNTLTTGMLNGIAVTDGVAVDNAVQGFRIVVSFIQHGPEGDPTIDGSAHGVVEAQLDYRTHDAVLSLGMRAGPFAYRAPIYARPGSGSWSSVYDYMGNDPTYEENEGRIFSYSYGFALSDEQKRAIFERVAGWNEKMFNATVSHARWRHEDLENCEGTVATTLEVSDYDDFSTYIAWHEAEKGQVEACAANYPFTDPAGIEAVGDDVELTGEIAFFNAFPAKTLPAGALVGIVKNGGNIFYIWRKTADDRTLADYDRDNMQGSVS